MGSCLFSYQLKSVRPLENAIRHYGARNGHLPPWLWRSWRTDSLGGRVGQIKCESREEDNQSVPSIFHSLALVSAIWPLSGDKVPCLLAVKSIYVLKGIAGKMALNGLSRDLWEWFVCRWYVCDAPVAAFCLDYVNWGTTTTVGFTVQPPPPILVRCDNGIS